MSARVLALSAAMAIAAGCAPEARWGHEAVYAPDLRAYVIARADPPTLAAPLPLGDLDVARRIVLTNPITGEKLRCREQVALHLGLVAQEAATALENENRAFSIVLPVAMTMPPTWPGAALLVDVAVPLAAPPEGLRALLSAPRADALYADGKRALEAKRYVEAETLFERALAKSTGPFHGKRADGPERASYYLGALYEIDGRKRDAARAYLRFITRADIRDAHAYEDAERRVAALDPTALAPCRSQAPLTFAWPRPRR